MYGYGNLSLSGLWEMAIVRFDAVFRDLKAAQPRKPYP